MSEIKFCQEENVEQHMWKITYYNLIETLRKSMVEDPENKEGYKNALLTIVDEVPMALLIFSLLPCICF